MVIVELHAEVREIVDELAGKSFGQFFRRYAELAGLEHDRCAMSIRCADINAVMTTEFLESDPDVGLDVLDQMAHMRGSIRIRQGARNEYFSR